MRVLFCLLQALLGVPQFWLNCSRGHTTGLASSMIGMWLFGDLFKLYYYNSTESPLQLILCSFFQCSTDCAILTQFWIYREKNAQMTAKIAALQKAANEKQGKRPTTMLQVNGDIMAATGVSDNSSIELDYYGGADTQSVKDDALRPLSPHLITLEEEAN